MPRAFAPIVGVWPGGAPASVVIDGREYRRARWRQKYRGAVDQYREAVPRDSEHLFVRADGTYIIPHRDRFNPDMGSPVSHFLADHPLGRAAMVLGTLGRLFL